MRKEEEGGGSLVSSRLVLSYGEKERRETKDEG